MVSTQQTEAEQRALSPRELQRLPCFLLRIENGPPARRRPLIFVFGRRETAFVVQSGSSRRERVTDEGRAAEEKKYDEA